MKQYFFIGFIFTASSILISQEFKNIDSLLQKLNQITLNETRVDILNDIAESYLYVDPDRIFNFASEALNLSQEIAYSKGIAEAYNNLGIYYRVKGIYGKSINYTFKSLDIMEELNDQQGIARCYNLIGIIYFYLENFNLSLEYYSKALELNKQQNDKKWIAANSNNMGMIYERLGEYEKALQFYYTALAMNIELENRNWEANNYGNIGNVYLKLNNPQSLDYFKRRLYIKLEQNDKDGIARSNYLIGKYYYRYTQYDKAIKYLLQSIKFANESGSIKILSQSTGLISNAYAALEEFKDAYEYHLLYKIYDDSLNIEESTQQITQLEVQNQFQESQQLKELEYARTKFLYLMPAIGLLFLVIAIFILIGRQKSKAKKNMLEHEKLLLQNKKLMDELEFKKKLLQDNIFYLVEKNDLLSSVIQSFNELKKDMNFESQQIINDVIIELKAGIEDNIWEEFELRFKQIHSKFYEKLNIHFPDLSSNEKKLCAFFKLNLSTKEISSITHQSKKSIETARSRLRKKLQISDNTQSLSDFLSKY